MTRGFIEADNHQVLLCALQDVKPDLKERAEKAEVRPETLFHTSSRGACRCAASVWAHFV